MKIYNTKAFPISGFIYVVLNRKKSSESMAYALVTGASKGIGRSIANELASRQCNLLLVSLSNDGLEDYAWELKQKYGIQVLTYTTDLTESEATQDLLSFCESNEIPIDTIVNNAGFGLQGALDKLQLSNQLEMVRLNSEVMVKMIYNFMPMLKQQENGYILNVGSMASFMMMPNKTLYSASKNFVKVLSCALNEELKDTNISVSCLCPGPTITNPEVEKRTREQGLKAEIFTLSAAEVAKQAVEGMMKPRTIIIPGWPNRILATFIRLLPEQLVLKLTGNMFSTQY